VSLEGSLQTVALPEVLHLLAERSKTGELRVRGTGSGGRLWFETGMLSGFEVGRTAHPVDALFDLLRIDDGEFVFDTDAPRPDSAPRPEGGDPVEIAPVIESAQDRLAEWPDIVRVVPSLDRQVSLIGGSPDRDVLLEGNQWSLIVAIGDGRSVQEVLDRRGLPEFDGCRSLKGLVEADLVSVGECEQDTAVEHDVVVDEPVVPQEVDENSEVDEAVAAGPDHDGLADRGPWTMGELESLTNNGSSHPEPVDGVEVDGDGEPGQGQTEPADAEGEADGPEPINRGLLLKFLSSVRS
jgi:hypothetical protein